MKQYRKLENISYLCIIETLDLSLNYSIERLFNAELQQISIFNY